MTVSSGILALSDYSYQGTTSITTGTLSLGGSGGTLSGDVSDNGTLMAASTGAVTLSAM